ncbi:hypothetical protein PR202_ga26497 [Eleusine coracana subsp. coracana]|uniref:BHLH domain-containing protein n=1 Tax=Eleusine coracana subsp. coracana TaxID=191504 RepID=A0AAV5DF43_ELECO|nr:hypothetical protein QOZ80_3AG0239810 [Eleusine coracana subsp. coracana]GJN08560.1 hypothetical protein PR202_ga26497 [Eleusine coracana subsp. coracana]
MFAHPLPGQQQYYTSPPAMVPPPNPFHPSYSQSSSFPSFGLPSATLPSPSFGAVAAVKNEPGQPSSSSNILCFGGQPPRTLSFSVGDDWSDDAIEAVQPVPERRNRAHLNTQEHVVAERRRREKMQQQFVALATIVPDLTKTDKISILGSTIEYVKQLEEKVKALDEQSVRRSNPEHTVFKSKCRISSDDDASSSRPSESASSAATSGHIPTVEARIHGDTILLKICCRERRGVLVMVFSELENQGLSIINTSVFPFTDSCLNITITVKARLLVLHCPSDVLDLT